MDRINARSENGYIRYYDVVSGDTVEVLTGGPKIIQHFWTPEEKYTDSAVNSSTSVIANGVCTITTGVADNDDHDFTSGLIFDPSKGLTAECRLALGDADQTAFNSDAGATTDFVGAVAVNTDTDGTVLTATSTALVDSAYHRYKVEIDPASNCKFYYDNVLVGTETAGVATTATLCAYFALINRESAANTGALSYMHAWQWIA